MSDSVDILLKYFPDLTDEEKLQFSKLKPLYEEWNAKINLISRKDTDSFYERHVLHSLGIAAIGDFAEGSRIMDLGTGGGFPGIPLAILYPDSDFLLVDSIRKKVTAVDGIIQQLGLTNAKAQWSRAEDIEGKFNVVVTRAVARTGKLLDWVKDKTTHMLALKGGDLTEEIEEVKFRAAVRTHRLSEYFKEEFFETKQVLELQW